MPSRPSPTTVHHHTHSLPLILTGSLTLTGLFLLILITILLYRKLNQNRTTPTDLLTNTYQCKRFSFTHLLKATNSFSESTQLGHGGFGSVYKASFPNSPSLAVKVMDSSSNSSQGEREFRNELSLASHLTGSRYVVSLLGFSSSGKSLALVYELMEKRSLQDALLDERCVELMEWRKRFEIVCDVAKGLEFLHCGCGCVVVHGDVKPSNVLLDGEFRAKIGDFGLARVLKSESLGDSNESRVLKSESLSNNNESRVFIKSESLGDGCDSNESRVFLKSESLSNNNESRVFIKSESLGDSNESRVFIKSEALGGGCDDNESRVIKSESLGDGCDNNGSRVFIKSEALVDGCSNECRVMIEEETESVVTVFEESSGNVVVNLSPEASGVSVLTEAERLGVLSEGISVMTEVERSVVLSENCGRSVLSPAVSVLTEVEVSPGVESGGKQKVGMKRDWWWKQDGSRGNESGSVKDYVMEWIGSEIKKERPSGGGKEWVGDGGGSTSRKKKKEKKRKPREWWKEEFCEELTRKKRKKKKKKRRGLSSISSIDTWFHRDDDASEMDRNPAKRKKRNSIDWWVDGLSGEVKSVMGRKNSQDSGLWCDVNVQKSGGVSSTPSMRGTVCYIAPECGGGGALSEKCDVYSFGVLLLVVVSGRRPLQVTASPMSEFERANLISWAKQLACNGKLLDLVDKSIHSLDKEQAVLCITIALLCLQRSPVKRPAMKEIVQMLSGASEPPHLPFEFSPSPPMGFPFKSRKKAR